MYSTTPADWANKFWRGCNKKYFNVAIPHKFCGGGKCGDHGIMVIVVGNGHGDTSSNPGRD